MAGTELAFEEFMAARWGPSFRTAYLLTGRRHDAEDLLQTALARTCVRWDKGAADAYVRRTMVQPAVAGEPHAGHRPLDRRGPRRSAWAPDSGAGLSAAAR